jgi:hypothetical protein
MKAKKIKKNYIPNNESRYTRAHIYNRSLAHASVGLAIFFSRHNTDKTPHALVKLLRSTLEGVISDYQ